VKDRGRGRPIGKRYRRQDEIGTPPGVTIDSETAQDDSVTLRDRDPLAQGSLRLRGASGAVGVPPVRRLAPTWRRAR